MALYRKELAAVSPLPFPKIKRGVTCGRPHACAATVQRLDLPRSGDVLIVDVYNWSDKHPSLRFASDGDNFLVADEFPIAKWTQRDPYNMIDIYHVDEVPGDFEAVSRFLKMKAYGRHLMNVVHGFIYNLRYDRRAKAALNERELREFHFRQYPALPKNLEEYCQTEVFDKHYLFFSKIQKHGKRDASCSCCGRRFRMDRGVKHNSKGSCPKCGAKVIYKADWLCAEIEDKAKICIADKSVNNELLLRWVDISRKYSWPDYKRKYDFTTNAYNLYLKNGKVYFYKWLCAMYSYGYYWYRGAIGDQCHDLAYIYTDNLDSVFGEKYYNVDLKAGLAGKRSQISFNALLNNLKNHPAAEYLFKMGMPRLASEVERLPKCEKNSFSNLLGIRAEYVQVYREADVSLREHQIIRCSQSWVSADMIRKYRLLNITPDKNHIPGDLVANMSFEKMVNYFTRQAKVCKRSAAFCMEQWNDYIFMCRAQNIDISSKSIKFPKNIVEAHDALALKVAAVKNAELDAAYAAACDHSYRKLNVTPYTKGTYSIVLSHSATELVAEGQALGHCVGNGSYAKRVISGNILILFVRLASQPEKPYATLEYSIGTRQILQLYGKGNRAVPSECRRFVEGYLRTLTSGTVRKEKRA